MKKNFTKFNYNQIRQETMELKNHWCVTMMDCYKVYKSRAEIPMSYAMFIYYYNKQVLEDDPNDFPPEDRPVEKKEKPKKRNPLRELMAEQPDHELNPVIQYYLDRI